MASNEERSLIQQQSRELTASDAVPSHILGEMVANTLALARPVASSQVDFDALVQEGKRIQKTGAAAMAPENIRMFSLFLQAANAGHVEGQYEVALCFGFGYGVKYDIAESDRWLRMAAENGSADAQEMLGMYRCKTNPLEAVKWLRKAAEQGESGAQWSLASYYKTGKGVPQDDCEAYAWLQLSADFEGGWVQEQATAVASQLDSKQLRTASERYQELKAKYSARK